MAEIIYHGTCDTTFAPRVEHVPPREIFPEYYRLWLNAEVFLTFSREQFSGLRDVLEPAESDESYQASEALQQYREPFATGGISRVNAALRKYVTEQNRGVHPVFAPILESICPTESDLERARRRA